LRARDWYHPHREEIEAKAVDDMGTQVRHA
jgi:hypothetical protein